MSYEAKLYEVPGIYSGWHAIKLYEFRSMLLILYCFRCRLHAKARPLQGFAFEHSPCYVYHFHAN